MQNLNRQTIQILLVGGDDDVLNAAGNFRSRATAAGLTLPYKARVRSGGKVNSMASAQMDGDCNVCHTVNGLNGAPGRVFLAP